MNSASYFLQYSHNSQQAIIHKAPTHVIKTTLQHLDCVNITDSLNHYPLDVSIKYGLKWDEGMKERHLQGLKNVRCFMCVPNMVSNGRMGCGSLSQRSIFLIWKQKMNQVDCIPLWLQQWDKKTIWILRLSWQRKVEV